MIKYSKTVIRDRKTDHVEVTLEALRRLNANWNYAASTENFNIYKIEEHLSDADINVPSNKDIRGLQ